jgi:hypothetical protein
MESLSVCCREMTLTR